MMEREKKESCAKRLAIALAIRNMKQADLCASTGIPKASMSQYKKGSYEPKQDKIFLMAKALNVNEAWLMGYDVPMAKRSECSKEAIPTSGHVLNDGEEKLLNAFRQVPEEMQNIVLDMLMVFLNNHK